MADVGRIIGSLIFGVVGGIVGFALGAGNPVTAIKGAGAGAALFWRLTKPPESENAKTGGLVTQASNEIPVPIVYGEMRCGGNLVYHRLSSNKKTLYAFVAYSEGEIDNIYGIKINNIELAEFDSDDWSYTVYKGTPTQGVDARCEEGIEAVGGLRNTAYLAITLKKSDRFNPEAKPNISAIVRGRKVRVWDSGTGAFVTQYSTNPVWCLLDLMTNTRYGAGFPDEQLDLESFKAAASYCAESVDGGPRFALNVCIDWQEPLVDLLDRIRLIFRGYFGYRNGKLSIHVEQPGEVAQAFTDADILPGSLQVDVPTADQVFDRVTAKYIEPGEDYRQMTASAGPGRADGKPANTQELELRGCTNFSQTNRLAYFYWAYAYHCRLTGRFKTTIRALDRTPGDVIALTSEVMGWEDKPVRITAMREAEDHTIEVYWREYNASVYTDTPGGVKPTPNYSTLPNSAAPPANVSDLKVKENGWINRDGVFVSQLEVSFVKPDDYFYEHALIQLSTNGGEYRDKGISVEESFIIPNVQVGNSYRVRVKSVSRSGLRSTGATSQVITVVGKDYPPSNVAQLWASVDPIDQTKVNLEWSAITDPDLNHYEVKQGATWDSAAMVAESKDNRCSIALTGSSDYVFWVKAVDNSGNRSTLPAATTIMVKVEPDDVGNLTAMQDPTDRSRVILTWDALNTPIDYYEIRRGSTWDGGQFIGVSKGPSFSEQVLSSGYRSYTVKARNLAGYYSAEAAVVSLDVQVEPGDVPSLLAVQNGAEVFLQWPAVEEPDVVGYEIREGATFEGGSLAAAGVTGLSVSIAVTTERNYSYHIKAINRAGFRSMQAASASVRVEHLPAKNVIFSFDEIAAHNGYFDQTVLTESEFRASNYPNVTCDDPAWGDLRADELGDDSVIKLAEEAPGQYYLSGTYTGPIHDMGALTTAFVGVEWKHTALSQAATACVLQARASNDGATWTGWADFIPGTKTFRYIQFRVALATTDTTQSAEVTAWVDKVDVPDVTDQAHGVAVPTEGLAVSFGRAFYGVPTVTATCRYDGTPTIACTESVSTTGFVIKIFDLAGTAVSGTVDWIAKGY